MAAMGSLETVKGDTKERKLFAILVCWLLGNGSLLAWNSMLTIEDYYSALFPKFHPTRVLTIVYQPCALITIGILTYREAKGNTRLRNLVGFVLFFVSSLGLIILDVATGGEGGISVFLGVCLASAIFGVADGFVEGGMVGDLALMCPEFMQSFMAGLAASGVLTSALRIMTKAAFEDSQNGLRKGALLFFAITCFFELLCLFLYAYVFPKVPIVKHYRMKAASEGSLTVAADLVAGGVKHRTQSQIAAEEDPQLLGRLSTKDLFLQNIDHAISLYLIYVLTLSIFPGFLSEDTGTHRLGTWYAIVLIAMYNVLDLIGRYLPMIECIKLTSRKGIMAATLSRFLLIPAFYFTAKYGDQGWMIFLTSFLGLTNGYLTVCIFTEAPKGYKAPEQNALGNILALCLLAGISSGVTLDWLWLIGKGW
ncbi:equilibrative nucleotide transporter 3-like [Carex rostrata]